MRSTALLLLALLTLSACAKKEEKEAEPVLPVEVAEVEKKPIARIIESEGILRALDQSAIMPKLAAPVAKFLVNRGDHVQAGQLLAVLESRDLKAAVADSKGAYDQAAANFRNVSSATVPEAIVKSRSDAQAAKQQVEAASKLLESREQLHQQGALARRLVDEARVAFALAKAQSDTAQKHLESVESFSRHEEVKGATGQMDSAKGRYDAAQAQLSYAEVRSPIAGVVADRPLFAGEMANPGTPLITIVNVASVIARVNLTQQQAAQVKVGHPATIASPEGSVQVEGKVTVVSPAIDAQSTTVEVWIQAANPGEKLRPGGTVHVSIRAGTVEDALVVPTEALLTGEDGGTSVMELGAGEKVHAHKVKVGIRNKHDSQILEGVTAGMKVVVNGGVGLEDGAKVKLEKPGDDKDDKDKDKDKGKAKDKDDDDDKKDDKKAPAHD